MIEKFYLETWKSVLGSSILHYSHYAEHINKSKVSENNVLSLSWMKLLEVCGAKIQI